MTRRPTTRGTQFYSMLGSRAIWHDGWKAVTTHPTLSGWGHFESDTWELYHTEVDRSVQVSAARKPACESRGARARASACSHNTCHESSGRGLVGGSSANSLSLVMVRLICWVAGKRYPRKLPLAIESFLCRGSHLNYLRAIPGRHGVLSLFVEAAL